MNDWKCKGAFFRCRVNRYIQLGKIRIDISYTLLKRRSCSGEPDDKEIIACCHGALELYHDDCGEDIFDCELELPKSPVHGAIYELKARPNIRSYNEDGYIPGEDVPQWYLEKAED